MSSRYHIVFPRGDRTRLSVVEIVDALSYELADYAVASRHHFPDNDSATIYAKELAAANNLQFEEDTSSSRFLD